MAVTDLPEKWRQQNNRELHHESPTEGTIARIGARGSCADELADELAQGETQVDVQRLQQQALEISEALREAGLGPCTLPEGVRTLVSRLASAQGETQRWQQEAQRYAANADHHRLKREEAEAALVHVVALSDRMLAPLRVYLDGLIINGDNIGDIRRSLFMPFDCEWNGIVRDETAKREQSTGETP